MENVFESYRGKHIALIGAGVSNRPLVKLFSDAGAFVTVCDKAPKLDVEFTSGSKNVRFSLGEDYLKNLDHDIIIKSPGIRFDLPELVRARENGSVVTSEMEIFFSLCPAEIIGVTGSDGKTTTTTLIYEILRNAGYTCHLGGNIGRPLLAEVGGISENDKVVVELSSFQLHTMTHSPQVAVITNISPNHLDYHKSMEEYTDAKKNIYLYQAKDDRLILNYDNEHTAAIRHGNITYFSMKTQPENGVYLKDGVIMFGDKPVLNVSDIKIAGKHNIENYMAAAAAVLPLVKNENIANTAKNFNGVEHRIEFVRELRGVRFYNDGSSSSPSRTAAALASFERDIILIAGGYDKKIPFDTLGDDIARKVKYLILMGQTAEDIARAVAGRVPSQKADSLEQAVKAAYEIAETGDTVILSPGCASFDMFKNFEQRGNLFKEYVNGLEQ